MQIINCGAVTATEFLSESYYIAISIELHLIL